MKKFLLIALLCVSGKVGAAFKDGNDLLSHCTESPQHAYYMYCLGYIASASDTHNTWAEQGVAPRRICTSIDVTQGQLRLIVVKYLEADPAELHLTASSLVLNALIEAFPCTE